MTRGRMMVVPAAAVLCLALTAEMCCGWGVEGEQVWDKTKETLQQAAEQAKEAAELVKDKIGPAVKGGADQEHGSGAFFGDRKNKEEASEKAHETIQEVKDMYGYAKEKLSQAAGDVGSLVRDGAGGDKAAAHEGKDMYDHAKEKISQVAREIGKGTGGEL